MYTYIDTQIEREGERITREENDMERPVAVSSHVIFDFINQPLVVLLIYYHGATPKSRSQAISPPLSPLFFFFFFFLLQFVMKRMKKSLCYK